jgi:hypothetical protein
VCLNLLCRRILVLRVVAVDRGQVCDQLAQDFAEGVALPLRRAVFEHFDQVPVLPAFTAQIAEGDEVALYRVHVDDEVQTHVDPGWHQVAGDSGDALDLSGDQRLGAARQQLRSSAQRPTAGAGGPQTSGLGQVAYGADAEAGTGSLGLVRDTGNCRDVTICRWNRFVDRLAAMAKVFALLALEVDMEKGVVPGRRDDAIGDGRDLISKEIGDQPQVRLQPKFLCLDLPVFSFAAGR